jgi:hypothetical protein
MENCNLGSARALACWRSRLRDRELRWEDCFGEAPKPAREGACAPQKKNAGRLVGHPACLITLQQRLNCALPFQSSSSLGFFRFQGLNGITEIPKNFGLSRRPIQSLTLRVNSGGVTNSP